MIEKIAIKHGEKANQEEWLEKERELKAFLKESLKGMRKDAKFEFIEVASDFAETIRRAYPKTYQNILLYHALAFSTPRSMDEIEYLDCPNEQYSVEDFITMSQEERIKRVRELASGLVKADEEFGKDELFKKAA